MSKRVKVVLSLKKNDGESSTGAFSCDLVIFFFKIFHLIEQVAAGSNLSKIFTYSLVVMVF